jgi:hypothetical protein
MEAINIAGRGTSVGTIYVGFGNGTIKEEALEDFKNYYHLNKKFDYEIRKAKLKPGFTNRWYFEVLCKEK